MAFCTLLVIVPLSGVLAPSLLIIFHVLKNRQYLVLHIVGRTDGRTASISIKATTYTSSNVRDTTCLSKRVVDKVSVVDSIVRLSSLTAG